MGLFNFIRTADINAGVEEYKKTDGAVLIDVRTAEEYQAGHIDGSINLPLHRISFIRNAVKSKSTPLFVYCYSGSRSGQAVDYFRKKGYTKVLNIGGICDYRGRVTV